MSTTTIFSEPLLSFRYDQKLFDPHDGLSLFGPHDTDMSSHPKNIIYGVIGTPSGIREFANWSKIINFPIYPNLKNQKLWPLFPGFREALDSTWPETPAFQFEIDEAELIKASHQRDPNQRAFDVVQKYIDGISLIEKKDEAFHVLVCVVPDEVWLNCRPLSSVSDGWGESVPLSVRKDRAAGQTSISGAWDIETYKLSVDFRRQIKARTMKYGVPIQIVRESTLTDERKVTPLSDRAWNLCTTLFYKAGGKPWKLASAREGVCYVGISFRKTNAEMASKTACCAAQMFLDSGDGVVFLGDEGPWYSEKDDQFHLSSIAAKNLLKGVLATYEQLEGKKLTEIFLHARSDISADEFSGYQEACPIGVKLVGIRVRADKSMRLFRLGKYPVMRGTFLKASPRTGFLWTSGFKPSLNSYDGWEVPVPLRIDIQHGEASIVQVSKDILGLTKLNYNSCKFGDSQPVTIGFSNAVGEILVSNPSVKERSPRFKFYI
ncbi:MAG: hypothetical protein QW568_00320 [Candidatus Anstonellaceae archaeon]